MKIVYILCALIMSILSCLETSTTEKYLFAIMAFVLIALYEIRVLNGKLDKSCECNCKKVGRPKKFTK